MLVQRAPSEGPRWTRAVGAYMAASPERKGPGKRSKSGGVDLKGSGRGGRSTFCARRTRTPRKGARPMRAIEGRPNRR